MAITATRRVQFAAGHRVFGHETKCKHPHGHNYVVLMTAQMDDPRAVDDIGRVVDFGVLKDRVGGWIERAWDHAFLVWSGDAPMLSALSTDPQWKRFVCPDNPTAENMARYLLHYVGPRELQGTGVRLVRVVVWETENCYAEATL